ncbi:LPXTG-site transpeptidase family protein, partial [hydrothermal vent metagenome]
MKLKTIVTLMLLTLGLWYVSASGYMLSKAWLSQYLIKAAWEQTLVDKQWHKPWSWADTYPVATLEIPRLSTSSYVLAGTSDRNLAFSITHLSSSGMPGQQKTVVLSGHQDSHFDYLQNLQIGD